MGKKADRMFAELWDAWQAVAAEMPDDPSDHTVGYVAGYVDAMTHADHVLHDGEPNTKWLFCCLKDKRLRKRARKAMREQRHGMAVQRKKDGLI